MQAGFDRIWVLVGVGVGLMLLLTAITYFSFLSLVKLDRECAAQCYPKFATYENGQCYCTKERQPKDRVVPVPQPIIIH